MGNKAHPLTALGLSMKTELTATSLAQLAPSLLEKKPKNGKLTPWQNDSESVD